MYKNIFFDSFNKDIHLWDDTDGYQKFKYQEYAYTPDPAGQYTSIDGHKVKKITEWSEQAQAMGMIYESNVPATTRTLVDLYYESDEISTNLVVLPLDIEVAKEGSYSTVEDANNTITAISYYSYREDLYYCLLLDNKRPPSEYIDDIIIQLPDSATKKINAKYITFKTEFDLLKTFIREYKSISPDIITGWNCEFYDIPYLYNRITKILGKDWANLLSPIKICKSKPAGDFNQLKVTIAGVSVLDYLMLYKKFTYSESPNYKLDTIAKNELGRGKVEYSGDLQTLYETDIKKFAEYNIIDVELIVAMDSKLMLLDIARGICHKGHVAYEDIIFSSRYLDGASLVFCKLNGVVASTNKAEGKNTEEDTAEGAFVKEPTPGLYKWVYDIDLTSLYPSNIISLNISPETKFGRVLNYSEEDYSKKTDRKYKIELIKDRTPIGKFSDDGFKSNTIILNTADDLTNYLISNNLSISSNGILYTLNKPGLIPSILKKWFAERKEFNKLKAKYAAEGDKNLQSLYDKKQLVTKILLNSFYGALLLKTFRFYDKDNGEAVTLTGQSVIRWSMKVADSYYSKILGEYKELCLYLDTDSLFYSAVPIIEKRYGIIDNLSDEQLVSYTLEVASEVQSLINKSYNVYAKKLHNVDDHMWNIKQEYVSKRALWLDAKKRYAQWIVNKEGLATDKIEVKGIDVVRSNFPKAFRTFMKEILSDILHDCDKDYLNKKVQQFGYMIKDSYIYDIMLPTGVKELHKWKTDGNKYLKGTPVHVKAALNYNKLLDFWKIANIPKLTDGDKILWCYLKQNEFGFESIASTGDDLPKVFEFITKHIDRVDLFENTLKNKLQSFWDAMGWGSIQTNANTNKFFKF